MFKKTKKWINQNLLIFLERKIEIEQLKEDRDFWRKESYILINKYVHLGDIDLELLNIKSFLTKQSKKSLMEGKTTFINSEQHVIPTNS